MNIINDNTCVWLTNLPKRASYKTLTKDLNCDYLIIGAGYTGLSAARKLSELDNSKKITIVDAQLAGEGGSARNSGYLVDTTLNDLSLIHISEPTRRYAISYAVFCLKKKKK